MESAGSNNPPYHCYICGGVTLYRHRKTCGKESCQDEWKKRRERERQYCEHPYKHHGIHKNGSRSRQME